MSQSGGSRLGRRFRATLRLAVQFFLVAVLVTAAAAWLALAEVRATFESELGERLEATGDSWEAGLVLLGTEVGAALDGVADYLPTDEALVERLLREATDLRDAARPLMLRFGLDMLEILSPEGKVLSSGDRPARINLDARELLGLPADEAVLQESPAGKSSPPWITHRRSFVYGSRTLILVGAKQLDIAWLDRVAGAEAAVYVPADPRAEPLPSRNARGALAEKVAPWIRGAMDADRATGVLQGAGRSRWWVVGRAVYGRGASEPAGWGVVAVDRGRSDLLLARMGKSFVILGTTVGLLAALAGVLIARATTRPVRELVHAFDAIAAGEADYAFEPRGGDEMQEVLAAFSRMHRALETQRRRSLAAERVAAWREVARHVAHEVKNPLAPIRLTVENLIRAKRQAPDRFEPLFREGMQTILEEVQQLTRIVGEFAEFARLPLPSTRPVELEGLIDRAIELYGSEPGVNIVRRVEPDLPPVELDPDQISRAIKNVVANAIDAARERPPTEGEPMTVEIRAEPVEDSVEIEIRDHGPGFSEEASRRIFEPYFTTKEHGTGLGMALSYRIIVEHGGVIYAENHPEGGAKVVIRLPLRAVNRAEAPAEREANR